jgi:hypothetical protein
MLAGLIQCDCRSRNTRHSCPRYRTSPKRKRGTCRNPTHQPESQARDRSPHDHTVIVAHSIIRSLACASGWYPRQPTRLSLCELPTQSLRPALQTKDDQGRPWTIIGTLVLNAPLWPVVVIVSRPVTSRVHFGTGARGALFFGTVRALHARKRAGDERRPPFCRSPRARASESKDIHCTRPDPASSADPRTLHGACNVSEKSCSNS